MKKISLIVCLLVIASISFGSFSLGLMNIAAKTESFSDTPLSGFVGIDVLGLDLRYDFGPLSVGVATPFLMFALSEDLGLNPLLLFRELHGMATLG